MIDYDSKCFFCFVNENTVFISFNNFWKDWFALIIENSKIEIMRPKLKILGRHFSKWDFNFFKCHFNLIHHICKSLKLRADFVTPHVKIVWFKQNIHHFNSFHYILNILVILLCVIKLNHRIFLHSNKSLHDGVQMKFQFCHDSYI